MHLFSQSKKIFFSTCLIYAVVLFCIFPKPAFAEQTSIKISPSLVRIEADAPSDIRAPFILENQSNQPISLKIGYKIFDKQKSRDGIVNYLNTSQAVPAQIQKFFDNIQVVDQDNNTYDSVELGPKQKKRLQLRIVLTEPQQHLDYYFSLVFLERIPQINQNLSETNVEKQITTNTLQTGIAMNVLLAVGPKVAPQGIINNFTAPLILQSGPVPFTLKVTNNGIHYITTHGKITIRNILGQQVGTVEIPNSDILAGTSRMVSSTRSDLDANNRLLTDTPHLYWPKEHLFGLYTATLSYSLSDEIPTYTKTIHFFILPLITLIEVLIVLVIIILVYLRIKKKLSWI